MDLHGGMPVALEPSKTANITYLFTNLVATIIYVENNVIRRRFCAKLRTRNVHVRRYLTMFPDIGQTGITFENLSGKFFFL
jgi:hypothetical protein